MKIGIIAVGRDCAENLDEILYPWIQSFRFHDIHICLISATFKEMELAGLPPIPDKATSDKIKSYALKYPANITSVSFDNYATEAEVREKGRQILMAGKINVDAIWLLDIADEYYTEKQISSVIRFIEKNSLIAWFKLSLKNYVFNKTKYLTNPFQPPRIWYTRYGDKKLSQCNYDNDFIYKNPNGEVFSDKNLPYLIVPANVAWIKHLSWLSDERSKKKIEYQLIRWNTCSYKWDHDNNCLTFNEEYYNKLGLGIPEVADEINEYN
jgi:hypothetical protein